MTVKAKIACASAILATLILGLGLVTSSSAGNESTTQESDAAAPEHPGVLRAIFKGHTDQIFCIAIGKDGTAASGGADKTVRLWDAATGKERLILQHTNSVFSLAFSGDGKTLATGDADSHVNVWDVNTGANLATLKGLEGAVRQIALSGDGKIVGAADEKSGRVWNLQTGNVKMTFSGRFTISPDGWLLATSRLDGAIQLWDTASGKAGVMLEGHKGNVNTMEFSPDGKTLASGAADRRGRLASGKEPGQDNLVKLWEVRTGKNLATLEGHKKGIGHLMFAPDGKTLVATDFHGDMKLWDLSTYRVIARLETVKVGQDQPRTPIGNWAVAPNLKNWAVSANGIIEWFDIADFTGK